MYFLPSVCIFTSGTSPALQFRERNVDLFPWSWNASKYYVEFLTSLGKCLLASQLNIQIMQIMYFIFYDKCPLLFVLVAFQ